MATQKTQRVEVKRAFYHKGEPVGVGSVLELPISIAVELRSANKVDFVQSDTKLSTNKEIPKAPSAKLPDEGGDDSDDKAAKKPAGKGGDK